MINLSSKHVLGDSVHDSVLGLSWAAELMFERQMMNESAKIEFLGMKRV